MSFFPLFCHFYSVSTFLYQLFFILHQLFILYQLFLHQLFLFCISSKESSINFFYSASTLFILHLVERIPHQLCLFCINFFYSASRISYQLFYSVSTFSRFWTILETPACLQTPVSGKSGSCCSTYRVFKKISDHLPRFTGWCLRIGGGTF